MAKLAFRNLAQKVLFDTELSGQISDGNWENSSPRGHWKPWCSAETIIDPENLGKDFYAQRESYNFTSKDLLDVVGERMVYKVRVALACGYDVANQTKWDVEDGKLRLPAATETHEYWKQKREELLKLDVEKINAALADEKLFTRRDMMRELKDMKKIIKMRRA